MTNTEKPDWREPLYTCAQSHSKTNKTREMILALKEFSFLGDYRDAASERESCRAKLEEICRHSQDVIAGTKDLRTIIKEIAVLKQFEDVFDCEAQLADAQQKKLKLYRMSRRKRRIGRLLLTGVLSAGLAAVVYVFR